MIFFLLAVGLMLGLYWLTHRKSTPHMPADDWRYIEQFWSGRE